MKVCVLVIGIQFMAIHEVFKSPWDLPILNL